MITADWLQVSQSIEINKYIKEKMVINITQDQLQLLKDLVFNNGQFSDSDEEKKEFDELYERLEEV